MLDRTTCRAIEAIYFNSGECRWPDEQIDAAIGRWEQQCSQLAAGKRLDISESMGSCECGDITAEVWQQNNQIWCKSTGSRNWQRYEGPASECYVAYGVGVRARQLAAAFAAVNS